MRNEFKIFKSSAGSGKTFTLVKEYLGLVLKKPEEYRHILALTFTNKATEEMKNRIVDSLIRLSKNENEPLQKILAEDFKIDNIRDKAQQALDFILHDYSNFSICTIDSFFNRIIRSLAKEIQLPLHFEVQLEQDEVIAEITNELMMQMSSDPELLEWLTDFAIHKLGEDKGWNVEREIHSISKELFREHTIDEHSHSRREIKDFFNELRGIKSRFEGRLKTFGNEGMQAISAAGLEVKDFAYGESGVANYFNVVRMNSNWEKYLPGKRASEAALDSSKWASKSSPKKKEILALADLTLQPLLQNIIRFVETELPLYLGALEVLKKIFLLGIMEDLKKKLQHYRLQNEVVLISETPGILNKFISEEEAPFVYEKSGTRFHHFLIDEVQDTSTLQWKNLLPLVINALGSGNFGMVVGDVKQSIYRWRGGNMHLLDSQIEKHLHGFRSLIINEKLDTNYRSRKTIVDFNNEFFSAVPALLSRSLDLDAAPMMERAYSKEAAQKAIEKKYTGGRVEIHAIENEIQGNENTRWKVLAKQKMLDKIRDAETRGYSFRDIAIMVRTNSEGDEIATWLIENGITRVISPDSLLLMRSPEVRFLLNLLIMIDDSRNRVAKSEVLFYYTTQIQNRRDNLHAVFADSAKRTTAGKKSMPTLFETESLDASLFGKTLPVSFTTRQRTLSKLPLYELCEQLVEIFSLPKTNAYVLRFLEMILEYAGKHDSSIRAFLNWWKDTKAEEKISVVTSESGNSIRITSIHKSKGLQFPVVIIPFAEWKLLPESRDVLWVESSTEPFARFGKIPLSPNKAMKLSCFKDSYQEERIQALTDNINLMYVAFTRAEEELYVFIPSADSAELNSTGKLIRMVVDQSPKWELQLTAGNALELGDLSLKKAVQEKQLHEQIELKNYPALNWNEKIRLSMKSNELIEILESSVQRAINYGVLAHRILSSIGKASEVNRAVEKFHAQGMINETEKKMLSDEIRLLLEEPEIASFFSGDYQVMNEHEIILPDGETLRPDRVMIKGRKAIVIDFKSGKEHASHARQVNYYGEVLSKMNFTEIEKYLIYIREKRILRVP